MTDAPPEAGGFAPIVDEHRRCRAARRRTRTAAERARPRARRRAAGDGTSRERKVMKEWRLSQRGGVPDHRDGRRRRMGLRQVQRRHRHGHRGAEDLGGSLRRRGRSGPEARASKKRWQRRIRPRRSRNCKRRQPKTSAATTIIIWSNRIDRNVAKSPVDVFIEKFGWNVINAPSSRRMDPRVKHQTDRRLSTTVRIRMTRVDGGVDRSSATWIMTRSIRTP